MAAAGGGREWHIDDADGSVSLAGTRFDPRTFYLNTVSGRYAEEQEGPRLDRFALLRALAREGRLKALVMSTFSLRLRTLLEGVPEVFGPDGAVPACVLHPTKVTIARAASGAPSFSVTGDVAFGDDVSEVGERPLAMSRHVTFQGVPCSWRDGRSTGGVYHPKFILAFVDAGADRRGATHVIVIVTTANLSPARALDGSWMQAFPRSAGGGPPPASDFGAALTHFLVAHEDAIARGRMRGLADGREVLRGGVERRGEDAALGDGELLKWIRAKVGGGAAFDFSGAKAQLVATVPGRHPMARQRRRAEGLEGGVNVGHMRLRQLLRRSFGPRAEGAAAADVVLQPTSIGNDVGRSEFLYPLVESLREGERRPKRRAAAAPTLRGKENAPVASGAGEAPEQPEERGGQEGRGEGGGGGQEGGGREGGGGQEGLHERRTQEEEEGGGGEEGEGHGEGEEEREDDDEGGFLDRVRVLWPTHAYAERVRRRWDAVRRKRRRGASEEAPGAPPPRREAVFQGNAGYLFWTPAQFAETDGDFRRCLSALRDRRGAAVRGAMPHLKSVVRGTERRVEYCLLTSACLSRGAVGEVAGDALEARNFELGVLFVAAGGVRYRCGASAEQSAGGEEVVLPLPYELEGEAYLDGEEEAMRFRPYFHEYPDIARYVDTRPLMRDAVAHRDAAQWYDADADGADGG